MLRVIRIDADVDAGVSACVDAGGGEALGAKMERLTAVARVLSLRLLGELFVMVIDHWSLLT